MIFCRKRKVKGKKNQSKDSPAPNNHKRRKKNKERRKEREKRERGRDKGYWPEKAKDESKTEVNASARVASLQIWHNNINDRWNDVVIIF